MATQTEPVTTEPTGALFRALRSVDVEPNLAYEAAEESRRQAGENVIAALEPKIDSQSARIDVKFPQIESLRGCRMRSPGRHHRQRTSVRPPSPHSTGPCAGARYGGWAFRSRTARRHGVR